MSGPAADRAGAPRLLAVSDGRGARGSDDERLTRWLRELAAAGVDAVQLREKELDDRRLFSLARRARALLPPPIRLWINGRADVAVAAGADGVHLPAAGLPAAALHRRFPGLGIAVSTHRLEEIEQARAAGADWVTFGPVYPTPSKAAYGPPPGLEGLRRAAAEGLPVVALGGVGLEQLEEVAEAGAVGAAGIRAFAEPAALPALVARAREIFPGPRR